MRGKPQHRDAQENGHGERSFNKQRERYAGSDRKRSNSDQDIRQTILNYFKGNGNKKLTFKQLKKSFNDRYPNDVIFDALQELVKDKHLQQRGQAYSVIGGGSRDGKPSHQAVGPTLEGTMDLSQGGMGFVAVEGYDRDIRISPRNTNQALPGDIVKIVLLDTRGSARIEGRVVEIVERKSEYITGTLEIAGRVGFVVPDKKNISIDFFVNPGNLNNAQHGDKVVAKFLEWKPGEKNPEAEVVRILGPAGEHDTEMQAILVENGFRLEFPKEVMDECARMEFKITGSDEELRRDMRGVPTFTIDPVDAKDFDDALSFRRLENGLYEVGIHIADVTHYVHADTMTDIEAALRATSVYLVDRVVPMLPEKLSNELCSLRPHEDKLTFSVVVQMDDKGRVVEQWIGKTIIHSNHRFSYEDAQDVLEGAHHEYASELHKLNELAYKLRAQRYKKGAINFETVEVKFKLDEDGVPIGVYVKERKDSNMLIEDFMLLANRLTAEFMSKKKLRGAPHPFVYRVHDLPNEDKIEDLKLMAGAFGYKLNTDTPEQIAKSFNKMMEAIKGKPEQNMLESLAIRTMAKAIYTSENIGHYGLAFEHYTHFTSPIRRYPDMLAHRILADVLYGEKPRAYKNLESLLKHSSEMERSAAEAERTSVKLKQVEYMSKRLGETYDGIITGVTQWGMFVEIIENKCEGLVRLNDIPGDTYVFEEGKHMVRGVNRGKVFKLGDEIKVKAIKADIKKRQLDYMLADVEEPGYNDDADFEQYAAPKKKSQGKHNRK